MSEYKRIRNKVLELYKDFKATFEALGKTVSENISDQAERIEKEEFNLMVIGEAKSGKSTFINAYIGKSLLPMAGVQCTSAIIKIKRGEKAQLRLTKANESVETLYNENEIEERLKEIATVPDGHDKIPVAIIDEYIIENKGEVSDVFIESLDKSYDKSFPKIDDYRAAIKEYVGKRKEKWGDIITNIEIIYPLSEAMEGITLIDSPGVNAQGSYGSITKSYLKEANAVVFVKPLTGAAINATPFKKFVESCPEKIKNNLFLVLSHRKGESGNNLLQIMAQAKITYADTIGKDRIISVDSMYKLVLEKCKELGTAAKIDNYFIQLDDTGEYNPAVHAPIEKNWHRCNKNVFPFYEKIEEESNFESAKSKIEQFARKAYYQQLCCFIENLEKEYRSFLAIQQDLRQKFISDNDEKHIRDIEDIKQDIENANKELSKTQIKQKDGTQDILQKYTGSFKGGIIDEKAKEYKTQCNALLDKYRNIDINKINDDTFLLLKKDLQDKLDDVNRYRCDISKQFIEECNKSLENLSKDGEITELSDILFANFTFQELDEMNEAVKKTADEIAKLEKLPCPNANTHNQIIATKSQLKRLLNTKIEGIAEDLDSIIDTFKNNLVDYINECLKKYEEKLTDKANELRAEYEKLAKELNEITDLKGKIQSCNENIKNITNMINNCNNIKIEVTYLC